MLSCPEDAPSVMDLLNVKIDTVDSHAGLSLNFQNSFSLNKRAVRTDLVVPPDLLVLLETLVAHPELLVSHLVERLGLELKLLRELNVLEEDLSSVERLNPKLNVQRLLQSPNPNMVSKLMHHPSQTSVASAASVAPASRKVLMTSTGPHAEAHLVDVPVSTMTTLLSTNQPILAKT